MIENSTLIDEIFPKGVIEQNEIALEGFNIYQKTKRILERADLAIGRKTRFEDSSDSSINTLIEITNAQNSTTKI